MKTEEIQAIVKKVQGSLTEIQTSLTTIAPAAGAVTVQPLAPEVRKVEIVPEILAAQAFRTIAGLVGVDKPRTMWMVLPKEVSISPGLETLPVPEPVQKWQVATRWATDPKDTTLFSDIDNDGLTLWEEFVLGLPVNTLFYGLDQSVSGDKRILLQVTENQDSGATLVVEVGDGKASWRAGVEGTDYTPMKLTAAGLTENKWKMAGCNIRQRQLRCGHRMDSGSGFLRLRLSQTF